jgi:uncharacterized protein YlxW (UPF0749 family)
VSASLGAPRSQALVAVVAFLLGILVVVQIRSQAGNNTLAAMSSQDLTFLVANLNTRNDQLRREIATLQSQLADLQSGGSLGTTSVNEIRAEIAKFRAWAGLDTVGGRGIQITVNGPITASAVEDLVNELKNAGAEAISIEDVRVVPGTVFGGTGGAGGGLSVDDTALGDPFTIRAIGTPATLTGSLARAGGIIAQLAATDPDATIDVEEATEMVLPATTRNLVPSHGLPRA